MAESILSRNKQNTAQKSRIEYIDIAKCIGILLVLLGHLLPDDSTVKSMIYSFHMPLFFIASGFFIKDNESFANLVSKKFYGVFMPYILWAFIFSGFSFKNTAFILYSTNESLQRAGSNAMLWFLASLFYASIISGTIVILTGKSKKQDSLLAVSAVLLCLLSWVFNIFHDKIVISGSSVGLPLAADVTLLSASFMLTGKLLNRVIKKIKSIRPPLILVLGIVLSLFSLLGIVETNERGYSQMATYDIGNPLMYWAVGLAASLGIIFVSYGLCEIFGKKRNLFYNVLLWIGQNSLILFIAHRTIVYELKDYYAAHDSIIILLAAWIALIIYSSVAAFVIDKFAPFLAGKYRPKRLQK